MRRISLKIKIVVGSTLFAFVFGGILSLIMFYHSQSRLFDLQKNTMLSTIVEQTHETNSLIDKYLFLSETLTKTSQLRTYITSSNATSKEAVLALFENYRLSDPENILAIYFMDTSGITQISTDKRFVNQYYGFRSYFQGAIQGYPQIDVNVGSTSKELGYYFAYPSYVGSSIKGVLVVKMSPKIFSSSLKEISQETGGTIMMTDQYGVILYSNNSERILKSLGKLAQEERQKLTAYQKYGDSQITPLQYGNVAEKIRNYSNPSSVVFDDLEDGEVEFVGIARVRNLPYFLILELPSEKLSSMALHLAALLGASVFLFSFSNTLFVLFIISRFLRPLSSFANFSKRISQGDFSASIQDEPNDELGDVAKLMNSMVQELRHLYTSLQMKVQEETQALNNKISELEEARKAMLNLLEDVNIEKNLSEQRAQELQKFQLAVDGASDHIVITDPEGIVLYANRAASQITGFTKLEILGSKAGVLWGKLMETSFYENLWDTIKNKKLPFAGEIRNKRKNGQIYIADAQIAPILDPDNKVVFFVGIEHDVTKAKEVDRMKTEFISLASHQLRTPLSAMKWLTEMLLDGDAGKLTAEQVEYMQNIQNSNERMIALVNSLLNVSRIESGRIIIDPKATNLEDLIRSVIKELTQRAQSKEIAIEFSFSSQLPIVNVDPQLVREVYSNLLANAINYTPSKGHIHVTVGVKDGEIISEISDTGYGIPEHQKDKIFQKFFRAENVVRVQTDGSGLGLYLVRAIVESSGGSIWFTSTENVGSTFSFTIPLEGMHPKKGDVVLNS